ncbi:MAG TPA: spore coat U domain-containing protein [Terracidiphilus sp.]|nr:spore coat U domain-containing protein [Terracidiphilus sp.]
MTQRLFAVALFVVACASITAQLPPACRISASNIQFGNFAGDTLDVTGTISINCDPGVAYFLGIDNGSNGTTVFTRNMNGPLGALLGYQLFQDPARTMNWGNTPGIDTVNGIGTGNFQTVFVYARIPTNQYAQDGSYTDPRVQVNVYAPSSFLTATSRFSVNATVLKSCDVSATSLNFAAYTGGPINATSIIAVTCTVSTSFIVLLDAGTAPGASTLSRRMTGPGGSFLAYRLCRDPALTLNWGNNSGADTESGTGTGAPQLLTVFGQLPGGQDSNPGAYSDTITVFVIF